MRVPRVRFTVRRMMVAVAILALLSWVETRRTRFQDLSAKYARLEVTSSMFHGSVPDGDYLERRMKALAARRTYYAGLVRKYRRAERFPWLPVAPDPPEP